MWPFKRRAGAVPPPPPPTPGASASAPESVRPRACDADPDLWNRLRSTWTAQRTAIATPPSSASLDGAAQRFGLLSLPPEVRQYLAVSDGTGGMLDDNMYAFWTLSRWEVLRSDEVSGERRVIVAFADYCIECWWYAVTLYADRTGTVYVADGPNLEAFPHATFSAWMMQYLNDPDSVIRP